MRDRITLLVAALMVFGITSLGYGQTTANTCFFAIGAKAGQTQAFPGFPPLLLGVPCNDGQGSAGFVVADGQPNPRGTVAFGAAQYPSCVDTIGSNVGYMVNNSIPKSGLA